jgi:hypothetical protein
VYKIVMDVFGDEIGKEYLESCDLTQEEISRREEEKEGETISN